MISLVVPTKNEEGNIKTFLASVPPEVEVIIVDSGIDDTETVVRELRETNLVYIRERLTIAQARQRGADVSSGEIIVFSDADVVFEERYFGRLPSYFERFDAVWGPKRCMGNQFPLYYFLFNNGQRFFDWLGIPAASGSNMACSRKVVERVKFDTRLPCNEDTEYFFRVAHAGFRVGYAGLPVYSIDERRLRRGTTLKMVHNFLRNCLLYANLYLRIPRRILESDWGYW